MNYIKVKCVVKRMCIYISIHMYIIIIMSSGMNMLSADSQITIVQKTVDQLNNLTISSVSDFQNHLNLIYLITDIDSLLNTRENVFNVQTPLIFTTSHTNTKPTLTVDSYSTKIHIQRQNLILKLAI